MRRFLRRVKNSSFQRKLLGYSLLLSIVPVVSLGAISSYIAVQNVQEEVEHNHQIILKQLQDQVDTFLRELEDVSIQLATNLAIEKSIELGPSMVHLEQTLDMKHTLNKYRSYSDLDYDISLIYSKFDAVYSNRYGLIKPAEFPYQRIIENASLKYNESVIIPPGTYQEQKELLFIRPIPLSTTKAPDGMLVLHVDAANLSRFLKQVTLGGERKLLVVDDQGRIAMSSDAEEMGSRLTSMTDLYHYWSSSGTFQEPITLGGINYHLSSQTSIFNDWTYIALTPTKELTYKANYIQQITWVIVIFLVIIWIFVAVIGSKRMYRPIQKLSAKLFPNIYDRRGTLDELKELGSAIHNILSVNQYFKSKLDEQLPDLKETFFLKLLRGIEGIDIEKKLVRYGFPVQGRWFYVVVVAMDQVEKFRRMYNRQDLSLFSYALRKVVEEVWGEAGMPRITVVPQPLQVVLIIGVKEVNKETDRTVFETSEDVRHKIVQFFPFTATMTISRARKGYLSISESYQECLSLLNYRLLWGQNVSISKKDIRPSAGLSGRVFIHVQKQIISCVLKGDFENAEVHLAEMIALVPKYVQNPEKALGLFSSLIFKIESRIQEMEDEKKGSFADEWFQQLYGMTSLKEVEGWFHEVIFPTVHRRLENMNISKQKQIVQRVIVYVQENYEEDLSLQVVADAFDVSASQLSRSFKEETGDNFGDFLIKYRMEKAKEWLMHTEMPIREIAERLRYTTVQSFTRVFKRVTGMPPGQYRRETR